MFSDTLDWALRLLCLIALPAALGLALLATPILSTLFQHGAFTAVDVGFASASLTAFAVGLPGFVGVKVLAPGYFARQDMRTPVRVAVVALAANLVLIVVFVPALAHAGLALATSGAALVNAGLLYRGLRRAHVHRPRPGWRAFALRVALANALMAAFLLLFRDVSAAWTGADVLTRLLRLTLLIGGGFAVYAGALLALGLRPRHLSAPAATGATD